MSEPNRPTAKGRGSQVRPPNRFGGLSYEDDFEDLESDPEGLLEHLESLENLRTEYIPDRSRTIIAENDSPDVGFRYSLNPYRGCQHGCSYCFARPSHEYLGLDAGLDFESKILVKHDAPALFRAFLARPGWAAETIALSPNTDAYQPGEREFRLTRGCLEVAAEARQPMGLITKNALILRDLDVIGPMAAEGLVHAHVSLTTLDAGLARSMEPRTSTPAARLRAIRGLANAGVPVGVLVAPVIPGLNDHEIPGLLAAAAGAGARSAGYVLLRLPMTVGPIFWDWLRRARPDRFDRVRSQVRSARGGKDNDSTFGRRMTGSGPTADRISSVFRLFRARHGLDGGLPPPDRSRFRPPGPASGQLMLF
ncbi:PA0069 family radical SAM protein [Tautonia plasticadhaerens]|uniref:Radical SAM superfamily protein n=1 Tax=Tautonia plasticadhaerens TaxID=2527974 RepID=A0A518H3I7_9BACT|nr:PA0069 family radical SAM protein [Tautonia plasticadhaerens]QDV35390.1 Radical SAM superfamily protein [Tautonia plasticadhaerens]